MASVLTVVQRKTKDNADTGVLNVDMYDEPGSNTFGRGWTMDSHL